MRFAAVAFDLWGTLVPPFPKKEHVAALSTCADELGVALPELQRLWSEAGPRRFRGAFGTVAEHFGWVLEQLGCPATDARLRAAERTYLRFTLDGLQAAPGALDTLAWLRDLGLRLAVVSNCASDVPQVWSLTPFASFFDACAFSSEVGVVKPDARIYQHALTALGVPAERTMYVGDGSSGELSGAARCGMSPVLISVDLSNTYDPDRHDVNTWRGRTIGALPQLATLIGATP